MVWITKYLLANSLIIWSRAVSGILSSNPCEMPQKCENLCYLWAKWKNNMQSLWQCSGSVLLRCRIGKRAMWQSESAGRDTVLYSGVTQEKHSPPRLWSTLLQALLPDLSSHLAQGLFSNSQHITATNHQCPSSSLCLLGLGQVEPSLQLLVVLGLPGAVCPSAAESLTQSISLPMPLNPQRWGHFLFLVSVWAQETWVFYQWAINILILSTILPKSTFAQPNAELKGCAHLLRDKLHSMNRTFL